jgi:hypothetical protein
MNRIRTSIAGIGIALVLASIGSCASLEARSRTAEPIRLHLFYAFYYGWPPSQDAMAGLPASTREDVEKRLALRRSYRPILSLAKGGDGIEQEIAEGRQNIEKMIVSIIGSTGARAEASRFARDCRLSYEYEGDARLPLREALSAVEYVDLHRGTDIAAPLDLIALYRFRLAFDIATDPKDPEVLSAAARGYRAAWQRLMRSTNHVAVAIGEELDAMPPVSGATRLHPRTYRY